MRLTAILILVLFQLLLRQLSYGSQTNTDSINTALLQKKIAEVEHLREKDSIIKSKLEKEIMVLKDTNSKKKQKLEEKLLDLEEKELNRLNIKKMQIDSLRKHVLAHPVKGFFNDTLFGIYSRLGSLSPKERSEIVSLRIRGLADFYSENDSIVCVESETTSDVFAGEKIIISVSENDALWNNTSRKELAEKYRVIINSALSMYKHEIGFGKLLKEIGLALALLIITFLIVFYIGKLFNYFAKTIKLQEGKRFKGFKINNYTLFDSARQVNVLLSIVTLFKWVTILAIIYLSLPMLFAIFPWTKSYTGTLIGYIVNPVKTISIKILNYMPNLITIIVLLFIFRYIFKLIHFFKKEIEKGDLVIPGFYTDWANPTYQIVKIVILSFMVVVIFPYLPGSDSPIFQGVSVFVGFLFTFGSMGSLSNIVAGLVLTYMRLFKLGDRVKIGEITGDVIEKSMLVTRIRTTKNEIISVPNSTVMSSHTINYSIDAPGNGLIIHSTVTIGYDVAWKIVHQSLIDAALKTTFVLNDPPPFVLQTSLDDFYVSYQINAYIRESNKQSGIYSDLHQNIQDVFNENGIEIMSPHYFAARDGNMTTIPIDYLD